MGNPVGAGASQPPHSIAPHPASGRPGIERAQTFPTPPASANSLNMGMGHVGSSYEYSGAHATAMHPGQPLSIDTGRSVPTTPASTPPANHHGAQYQTSQPYDNSRQMYSAPSTYGGYPSQQQHMARYGGMQSSPENAKTQMGPPARAGAEHEHHDSKGHPGYGSQQDADGEHEGEYTHQSASYDGRRPSYSYKPNPASGPIHSDSSHVSPELTQSPHQNGSGRATPRTTNPYGAYANTPQRATQLPSSNLSYGMNDTRGGAPNGTEPYPQQGGYQTPHYPSMNGAPGSNKRMRELDDEQEPYGRPNSSGDSGLKRQRTDPGSRPIAQPHSVKTGPMRR